MYLEDALGDDLGVLFLEENKDELCSFKSVRKVHKVNRHKHKEQLIAAYQWMSPELINVINSVVNDCNVCQKLSKSIARPRVTLPMSTSFNEVVTLDLKEFVSKYVLWMIDSLTRFMQGKM